MRPTYFQPTKVLLPLLLIGGHLTTGRGGMAAESQGSLPELSEIVSLIQTHLPDIEKEDLDRAALQGILTEFQSRLELLNPLSEQEARPSPASIALTRYYQSSIGYLAAPLMDVKAFDSIQQGLAQLSSENILRGLILDLRHVSGTDYEGITKIAGLFAAKPIPLLDWGTGVQSSEPQAPQIQIPLVALIDETTQGAGEALAGVIASVRLGIVVGRPTAGEAKRYREVSLASGHKLRLATTTVELANGTPLPEQGVQPDILVEDRGLAPPQANDDEGSEDEIGTKNAPPGPPEDDLILARAFELLKGIAIVEGRNRSE